MMQAYVEGDFERAETYKAMWFIMIKAADLNPIEADQYIFKFQTENKDLAEKVSIDWFHFNKGDPKAWDKRGEDLKRMQEIKERTNR